MKLTDLDDVHRLVHETKSIEKILEFIDNPNTEVTLGLFMVPTFDPDHPRQRNDVVRYSSPSLNGVFRPNLVKRLKEIKQELKELGVN